MKRWLRVHEDSCEDDHFLDQEVIPVAVELFRRHSGRILGIAEVEEIHDQWPECFSFCATPVRSLCGIWCAKDGEDWKESPQDLWHFDGENLRTKCVSGCSCGTCPACRECPTRWKVKYLAGQEECDMSPLDSAWVKSVVAEFYRVREASLETKYVTTAAFQRLSKATKRVPGVFWV